ncbi:alpha/beta hydrolase [Tropicibacter naphthalenivorans]|uniref:Monoterpene epsilon-lactone hydrolase n=1 Tax=Tropicibacter naphthalenivorans TaxID=441103 RepID=A0A0P1GU75_9RHOB|nr:alpha/beta hydrolase [Tropicibacter naphthalenivorans]CUH78680.1 Monoterpene epsilon-lactone hydrolase [Tropicibacter naphthalenivorans]SMC81225.1 Acetyl esterase/lipase [Tropicibacter naphthalenivorans]
MSWQLQLLNAQLRLTVKRRLLRVPDVTTARQDFDFAAAFSFVPTPLMRHLVRPGGLHWISAGPFKPGRVILYFHGGGYIVGSPWTHEAMLARLAKLSGVEVCAPRYRLAPEAPFPAAFDDACAAWGRLRALGYAPGDILIGGDSAGGGLALALVARLCQLGTPPAAVFALSPWTDLAMTGDSLRDNAQSDSMLPVARIEELTEYYLQGGDPRDPKASPLYAEFPECPPVLLHHSKAEILRDDTLRMAERLRAQGATVTTQAEETAPHVWHLFDGWIPEARQSIRSIARFVQTSFAATSR